jgi:hypothetical protein
MRVMVCLKRKIPATLRFPLPAATFTHCTGRSMAGDPADICSACSITSRNGACAGGCTTGFPPSAFSHFHVRMPAYPPAFTITTSIDMSNLFSAPLTTAQKG